MVERREAREAEAVSWVCVVAECLVEVKVDPAVVARVAEEAWTAMAVLDRVEATAVVRLVGGS